ncbi:hypothetical protein M404DRAFT_1005230 [Pisolithus tinctorius Marx 270]|uniref:Uncharacterized protein n=1 Tax=Pisolithus tinctorius Marx 270 TaxID=870435 RepID=A0A0C3JLW6_PISTI|nr:hypothetical protein M404DRAFT_1005230 [Pisolithus tinctorius Marx 270]
MNFMPETHAQMGGSRAKGMNDTVDLIQDLLESWLDCCSRMMYPVLPSNIEPLNEDVSHSSVLQSFPRPQL